MLNKEWMVIEVFWSENNLWSPYGARIQCKWSSVLWPLWLATMVKNLKSAHIFTVISRCWYTWDRKFGEDSFFPLIPINKWDKQTSKQVTPALSWSAWVREPAGRLFRKSLRTNTSEPTWRSGRAGIPGRGGSVGKSREARTSIILSGNKLCMCTCVYVPMLGTKVLQSVRLESVSPDMRELRCLENSLPSERWVPQESLKQEEDSIRFVPALLLVALSCIWPHGLQHTSLPCPSLSPGVCSNSFFVHIKVHWQQKGR